MGSLRTDLMPAHLVQLSSLPRRIRRLLLYSRRALQLN